MGVLESEEKLTVKILDHYLDETKCNSKAPCQCRLDGRYRRRRRSTLPSISEKVEDRTVDSNCVVSVSGIVESSSVPSFHVGDKCLVYPIRKIDSMEVMTVTDLDTVFHFSEGSFQTIARIPVFGLPALEIVDRLLRLYRNDSKILLLGDFDYIWWIINLLKHRGFDVDAHAVIATSNDEDLTNIIKAFPRLEVIQWNNDAYEEVLLNRTKEACHGFADVVVNCQNNIRHTLRTFDCCKEDGRVIMCSAVTDFIRKQLKPQEHRISYISMQSSNPRQSIYDIIGSIKS